MENMETGIELIELLRRVGYGRTAKVIEALVGTNSFRRLRNISYLASFKYSHPEIEDFSRWDHSIGTSYLVASVLIANRSNQTM